jgi:hypothetical protein
VSAFFTAFVGKVVLIALVLIAVAAVVRYRLHRQLRVSPDHASEAPLSWLVSPLAAARLHRRLQMVVTAERAATGGKHRRRRYEPATAAERLAADVEREAVTLDHRLVATSRLGPGERRSVMAGLAGEVARLERLTSRVIALSAEDGHPTAGQRSAIDELDDRVTRLEQARAEVDIIDARAVQPELQPGEPLPARVNGNARRAQHS